jgi:hypothetical protein
MATGPIDRQRARFLHIASANALRDTCDLKVTLLPAPTQSKLEPFGEHEPMFHGLTKAHRHGHYDGMPSVFRCGGSQWHIHASRTRASWQ